MTTEFGFFFFLFLVLFIGIFVLAVFLIIQRVRTNQWLRKYGTPVTAIVTRVGERYVGKDSAGFSEYKPYLEAEWRDPRTGVPYQFYSDIVHPKRFPPGRPVNFLIDPNNPKRYRIDVSSWREL